MAGAFRQIAPVVAAAEALRSSMAMTSGLSLARFAPTLRRCGA
jgi:hypothetical protein